MFSISQCCYQDKYFNYVSIVDVKKYQHWHGLATLVNDVDVDRWIQTYFIVSATCRRTEIGYVMKVSSSQKTIQRRSCPFRHEKTNLTLIRLDSSMNYLYDEFSFYSDQDCSSPKQLFPLVILTRDNRTRRNQNGCKSNCFCSKWMKFLDPVVLGGTMSSMKKGDNIDDEYSLMR